MELNFKKLGEEGPEIIILHGLFGMLDNWKTIARKLSTKAQVYIVDQRDHGKSPHTKEFNYKILAQDLMCFIEENQISPELLIGHSMGGKTVMQFLNDHPGYGKKAMVVDIGPLENAPGHEQVFKALYSFKPGEISDRDEAREGMVKHLDDEAVILFLMKNLSRNPEGGYRWKMNLDLLYENYKEILAGVQFDYPIATPSWFIKGSRSNYISEENLNAISDNFVDAENIEIEGAGHWVHADKGDELIEIIEDILDI